jgi:hypothetical protein
MHVSYYYKKVKIPTYIYNGGEGEEALFFSFLVFFSVYVYMSDKSTVKIDSILYPYLHTCFHLYTNTKKLTKRRNSCLVFAPHHLISLQAGSTASRAFIKNKKKKPCFKSSWPLDWKAPCLIGPSQGLARVCLPRSGPQPHLRARPVRP